MPCLLTPAHLVALGAYQFFILLLFININFAPIPLLIFVLTCCAAPFFPRISFFLPIISCGNRTVKRVSITFDDGPDPKVTPLLLELLAQQGITATFFVTGMRAEQYPKIIKAIITGGHTIGNHTYNHSPILMLKSPGILHSEIATAQNTLLKFGIKPLAFRPPVGITNPDLWRALIENGMFCVNFSCRARDFGNRRVKNLAGRLLAKVTPGDIILMHDVAPGDNDTKYLLQEFSALISGLKDKGLEIVPLSHLIGREVMQTTISDDLKTDPVALFYNGLAEKYDQEQFNTKVSLSRSTELRLFSAQIPAIFAGANRVLELGAGTGIFTLEIARNCTEVIAADISGNMLKLLEKKARDAGIANIRTVNENVETMDINGTFTVVCAFSALEYLSDLPAFFTRVARHIESGGTLYFITARSSLFRFITQIGNAMRQGLWLKAHSHREIEAMLTAAGFERIAISSHLLKSCVSGGMLLEVVARRPVAAVVSEGK